jgi:2-methylcitrate dehydratase PrpD
VGFTRRLVQFAQDNFDFDSLSPQLVSQSKDMMLNAAAAALAAAAQPEGETITQFVQEMRGNGRCTIIGRGMRSSPVLAALANGLMVHLLDFDDEVIPRGSHPSGAIFPVVMALGEMNGYSGRDTLTAFILGCEIAGKLGTLVNPETESSKAMFSPPRRQDASAGTIGATIAAGLLLGLDSDQFDYALGMASGGASGIGANLPTAGRALQCGQAAMNGVMAALLAQKGYTAARGSLESPGGLLGQQGERSEAVQREFWEGLGSPFDIIHPGITLKLYPCASASHTSIDAVVQLMQQYRIGPSQVESVLVSITPQTQELLPFATPRNGWEARACLSYLVAAALMHGHPLIDFFSDAAVQDTGVRNMMDRVTVVTDRDPAAVGLHPSQVTITLADGSQLRQQVDFARGQPELPLDSDELDAKFLYCTRYILPPDHIQEAIESFRDLDNIENITGMTSVLGG